MKVTKITKDLLINDGWFEVKDEPGIYMQKKIENLNPINCTPEDTDINLIIHGMYNSQQFAVLLPDGGMLNFAANSMERLKAFEKCIYFYDCPF